MDGFKEHDHLSCVSTALAAADETCRQNGWQFTPVRRRVLEILLEHHTALGAYEVLERLGAEGFGTKPPVAYRALAFLTDHGFAHRIERLNAFVACAQPGSGHHAPAFMICRSCGTVGEAQSPASGPLGQTAEAAGFVIEQAVVEAEGLCATCQGPPE